LFDQQLLTYTIAVGALTLVPGADTVLVMRNVLGRGRAAGIATALGIGSGLFVQASVSALGLSAILLRSVELFFAVKLAGALYLAGLGVWTIVSARRGRGAEGQDVVSVVGAAGSGRSYLEGLLTNVLNPKVVVFYLAFLPQFISPTDPVLAKSLLLAGIHFCLAIAWLSLLTLALGRMVGWLSRSAVRRRLAYFTGAVLVALGVRLALERP